MANAYQDLIVAEASLIHWWKLDETSGTTAADAVAGSKNATHGGAAAPTVNQAGIPAGGRAVLYNGTAGANASGSTTASLATGGSGLTVEAWVYLTGALSESKWVAGLAQGGSGFGAIVYLDSTRAIKFYISDGSSHTLTGDAGISLNAWHHLVGVAPTSGTAKTYVDGVQQSGTVSIGTPENIVTAMFMNIGGNVPGGFPDANFRIDEVALYNSALPGASILAHYIAGTSGNNTPLMIGF